MSQQFKTKRPRRYSEEDPKRALSAVENGTGHREAARLYNEASKSVTLLAARSETHHVMDQDDATSSSECDEPEDSAEALAESDAVEVETEHQTLRATMTMTMTSCISGIK
ncbi:hypothetical protein RvY_03911 [Ramazzottius varieornatus]|uniref:HTH psq-type domain-containing protein n=1 Tax=Ramazzottius varieornatus TaxID=947166 RepID=A0A1D1UTB1_RAMVA|nr:hypothetical protein RvY_03911 [Ramazzottius varieornatus]